jgi:uncharacterized protein (TIGR03437 family)
MSRLVRALAGTALALLVCAGAQAATISTTLTVNATLTIGMNVAVAGTASLTNGVGSGTFSSTLTASASGFSGPYTITLSGGGGTITGVLAVPTAMLTGASTTPASATVTGGTGTYSGANGSFPSLPGAGSIGSTGSITLSFTGAGTIGTGGTTVPTPPTITNVQDAASNTPNIAQGSIFVVKGSSLCPAGTTFYSVPRPTVGSDSVKITFTPAAGGTGTNALLWYEYNPSGTSCQLAGILPSTVPVGSYNVTVTNGTVSAPFPAQVVASKFELITQDSTGTGLASVQNYISATQYDLNRLTTGSIYGVTYSPAKPGQYMIAYGTGLGGYAAGDNSASPLFDFSKTMNIQAIVGGVSIPVAYAGRAGYAGEDQINFSLPSNIQTGCAVTLQISVNGVLSVPTSISIAPNTGSTACVMPGYTTVQLQNLDQGGTITTGGFAITQFTITEPQVGTVKSDLIGGGFSRLTGFQLASAAQANVSVIQQGTCQVIYATSGGSTASATGSLTYLDAGTVTINGPGGSGLTNQVLTKTSNSYSLSNLEGFSIPGQTSFALPAGGYSLSGTGGADVGSFSTSLSLASLLTLSSPLPSTVNRSSPLALNWSGGNAADLVEIIGSSSVTTGTGSNQVTSTTEFICLTTAGQRTFTVPASVLSQLPASTANSPGLLEVASGNQGATFSPTLKADGSAIPSTFGSFLGIGDMPMYQ